MKKILTYLILTVTGQGLFAQTEPVFVHQAQNAMYFSPIEYNGKLYFSHNDKLWVTDGTDVGTYQVKEFHPSFSRLWQGTVANNKLFLIANDSVHGNELWVSDGSTGGTQLVKDINPTAPYFQSTLIVKATDKNLHSLGNKVYFIANDGTNGHELWVSDGTDTGTKMVVDINTYAGKGIKENNLNQDDFGGMAVMGNKIYFAANDSIHGTELWVSDGTAAGTHMLLDINPVAKKGSNPCYLIAHNGKLYFSTKSDNGLALHDGFYVTDGTAAGTIKLLSGYIVNYDTAFLNGKLYFYAIPQFVTSYNRLFSTDGTVAGTQILDTIHGHTVFGFPVDGKSIYLTNYKGKLYFRAQPKAWPYNYNIELWTSDGTPGGAKMLVDLTPYAKPGGDNYASFPSYLTVFNDSLYFRAMDTGGHFNIWKTDGTAAGTECVCMNAVTSPLTGFSWINALHMPLIVHDTTLLYWATYFDSLKTSLYRINKSPVSVKDIFKIKNEVKVYPNPASDQVVVDGSFKALYVYDVSGHLLYKDDRIPVRKHIDIGAYTPGLYIIHAVSEKGESYFGEFLKE